jgi:Domain of unknown function (DUF4279)
MIYLKNRMNLVQIIEAVEKEITQKTLSATANHLALHKPIYKKDKLQVSRVDNENDGNIQVVYLPVEAQEFFFAVSVDTDKSKIISFDTEANHKLFFRATSIFSTAKNLMELTNIVPTNFWSKGEKNPNANFDYFYSAITVEGSDVPDELEDKLQKLLDILEQDKAGIKKLASSSNAYLQVISQYYISNGQLNSISLSKEILNRISDLELELNIEQYVSGNKLKME